MRLALWLPVAFLCVFAFFNASDLRAQNVLVNPSFEDGPATSEAQPFILIDAPSDIIPGWKVTQDQVKYVGPHWLAYDGTQSIDIDGNPGFGAIAQTFDSEPGTIYRLEFRMAGNPNPLLWPPRIKRLQVSAAGQSTDFFFDITGRTANSMGWIRKRWLFNAIDSTTTLEFRSLDALGGNGGAVIDDVVLVPVTTGFLRGDSNVDGLLTETDALVTLTFVVLGTIDMLSCPDAADINDDGFVDVTDPANVLGYLYFGAPIASAPFPACGGDVTEDDLGPCEYPLDACFD